jgi:uncharacterized NAD(P)/FAD-binding protein YdhS
VPEEAGLTVRTANRYEELAAPNAQLASALSPPERLQGAVHRVLFHDMHRDAFIAKGTEVQRTVEQLLAELQASEHGKFAAHLYRSRREYRSACQRADKRGKRIERCLIASFQVAETMGFKGDFRQWEQLLRIGD